MFYNDKLAAVLICFDKIPFALQYFELSWNWEFWNINRNVSL